MPFSAPEEVARGAACQQDAWRAKTWAEVSQEGVVTWDQQRGWHVLFSAVWFPGGGKPVRVRFNRAPQIGRFETKELADLALTVLRQRRCAGTPLHDLLAEYMAKPKPEQMVPHRWRVEFVAAKRVAYERAEISHERFRHLRDLPNPGYLRFWADTPVGAITGPGVTAWVDWLRATYPALSPTSLRHIVADFGTFCRFLRSRGSLQVLPEFPRLQATRKARRVPDQGSVRKILAEIPEAERGLFLARSLAGLRPAEARRADVGDYRDGVLRLRPETVKTEEPRVLLIGQVSPELDAWIRAHRAGAPPWEPLFPSPRARDGRWKPTPERRAWVAACDAARLERIPPNHGGRHAFATHEIAAGTDAWALKDWMGHRSVQTTQRYVDVDAVSLARRMRPSQLHPKAGERASEGSGKLPKTKEKA